MKKNKFVVTQVDRIILAIYCLLGKHGNVVLGLASGILLARITNELSAVDVRWENLLPRIFSIRERAPNIISVVAVILLAFIPAARYVTKRLYKNRRYDKLFAHLLEGLQDAAFRRYNTICLQQALTLQSCPLLDTGWRMSDIKIDHKRKEFPIPKDLQPEYKDYFKTHAKVERFVDDKVKVMLTKNPTAFADSMSLILETCETKYSVAKFYSDRIAPNSRKRDEHIRILIKEGVVSFAHSLCLHLVVVTSDNKILLTKRSKKVGYYPGKWSCSIEEQMMPEDISPGNKDAVLRWGRRALKEELGLDNDEELLTYRDEELKVVSVFLEGDCMNVSLCGYIKLEIDEVTLDAIIRNYPRNDFEFTDCTFVSFSEILNETFTPKKFDYHPTSQYRMLMALLHRYGETKVARACLRHDISL